MGDLLLEDVMIEGFACVDYGSMVWARWTSQALAFTDSIRYPHSIDSLASNNPFAELAATFITRDL